MTSLGFEISVKFNPCLIFKFRRCFVFVCVWLSGNSKSMFYWRIKKCQPFFSFIFECLCRFDSVINLQLYRLQKWNGCEHKCSKNFVRSVIFTLSVSSFMHEKGLQKIASLFVGEKERKRVEWEEENTFPCRIIQTNSNTKRNCVSNSRKTSSWFYFTVDSSVKVYFYVWLNQRGPYKYIPMRSWIHGQTGYN